MENYLGKGATISPCGNYRYRLWREWRLGNSTQWDMWTEDDGSPALDEAGQQIGEPLSCVFVMLNPSTADGEQDDPTIRRCVGFAKALGFDRMEVVNLFGWRATSPKDLFTVSPERDPCGTDNQRHIQAALDSAGMVVCAWGAHGPHLGQDETVLGWIDAYLDILRDEGREVPVVALGITKDGHPRHPLYLPSDAQPTPFGEKP